MLLANVRAAHDSMRELVIVEDLGKTLMLCLIERCEQTSKEELGHYSVGFPRVDICEIREQSFELVFRGSSPNIYGTVRPTKEKMASILEKIDYKKIGCDFNSIKNPKCKLNLFILYK